MTFEEAEKIIVDFHKSITDLRPISIVQSTNELPYTTARIKYAHFIYGERLLENFEMDEKKFQEILESYGIIESFFVEEPDVVNAKYRKYLENLRSGIITEFRLPNPFGEPDPVLELYNFLGEHWFLKHKTELLTRNALAAFLYDQVRDKATREGDLELLKDIINTAKTREVVFPGKKNNKESIFV